MSMTRTETIGFCSQVAQLIEENADALQADGIDTVNWIAGVNAKRDTAIKTTAEQDDLELKQKPKQRKPKPQSTMPIKRLQPVSMP